MAKSLRSKSKRSFRSKKRTSGKYAAAEAARLDRLHAKLAVTKGVAATPDDADMGGDDQPQGVVSDTARDGEKMSIDEPEQNPMVVSTHGLRGSRREEWRKSKGMDPVPRRRGMNRQGGVAARRKAGRPSRRR